MTYVFLQKSEKNIISKFWSICVERRQMKFIFQLREYPCNITHDLFIYLFIFWYTMDIFRTKTYIPRIFLEHEYIFAGKRHVVWRSQHYSWRHYNT